jgi:thiamine-phosphate pyrophosphorylase
MPPARGRHRGDFYNPQERNTSMSRQVLRILDANANRAREALRVIEDAARFILDDRDFSSSIKSLRHDLAGALAGILGDAILHRDTPGDVGTTVKTPAELRRADAADVVTAAGKRLGEALRTLEEYLKTLRPDAAAAVEALRYRFYHIEHQLAFALRPPRQALESMRLYVLITASSCRGEWLAVAAAAIDGGADVLQLREKSLESGELLSRARQLVELCHGQGRNVICIINDRPDIALLAGADGVHVGQDDLPARQVRQLIGSQMILGVSTHNIDHARGAVRDGADYIGVGPVYRSTTKPRQFVAGLEYCRQAAAEIRVPKVAISGISAENVDEVMASGIAAVAVTAAVCDQDDVRSAAERLKARLTANAPAATGA